jgi:hypothetical protein
LPISLLSQHPVKHIPLTRAACTEAQRSPSDAPGNLNINSNNPFRNRMSAASPSPRSPDPTAQQFPFPTTTAMSKNPFLDPSESSAPAPGAAVMTNGDGVALADDIFVSFTVA